MRKTFWHLLSPRPLLEEEIEYMQTSVHYILIASLVITGIMASFGLVYRLPYSMSVSGAAFAMNVLFFWWFRRGHLTLVRGVIPMLVFGIATYASISNEALHDEGVFIYPVTIALAGLLWGKRGITAYTALCIIAITAIGTAEINGLLNPPFQRPVSYFLYRIGLLNLLITFTAAILYLTIDSLIRSVQQARCLSNQAQQILAQHIRAEEENRTILRIARDGFSLINMEGRFLEVNEAYCQMLGYRREEFLQMTVKEINPTYQTQSDMLAMLERTKQAGSSLFETELKRKDGQRIVAEISVNYMELGRGRLFAFVRDTTARKQAEQALQQAKSEAEFANRSKTDFLYSVSHELRTPLNHILGYAQLLQEQEISGMLTPKQTRHIEYIVAGGKHLLSLIDDVLTLSRLELNKHILSLSTIPLKPLLEKSLINLRERDVKPQLSFAIHLSPELEDIQIIADYEALKQILFQLLSNAVKFTPDGGMIAIDAEQREKMLVIRITDNGIGIAPEQQARIFENFYQARSGLVGKTPGTGLGLPIARRLIELHGGTLWVESAGLGQGSCFSFSIPDATVNRSDLSMLFDNDLIA